MSGRRLLGQPPFRRIIAATGISAMGDSFTLAALPFAVLAGDGGATAVGVVLAARALPLGLLMLPAGVVGDRIAPQRILLVANLLRFAVQALTAGIVFTGDAPLAVLAGLQAVHGSAAAMAFPASRTILPRVVEKEDLQSANATVSSVFSTASIIGPLLAALLLSIADPAAGLAIDAASFLVAAVLLGRVPDLCPQQARAVRERSWRRELMAGFREVTRSRWLSLGLIHSACFQVLVVGVVSVLGPVIAWERYGGDSGWAVLLSCAAAGHLLGGMAALRWQPRRPLRVTYLVVVGAAPVLVALAAGAGFWLVAAMFCLYGVAISLGDTLWGTVVQSTVPMDRLAKVISFDGLLSFGLRPLGLTLIGPAGAAVGTGPALLASAAAAVLMTVTAVWLTTRPGFSPHDHLVKEHT